MKTRQGVCVLAKVCFVEIARERTLLSFTHVRYLFAFVHVKTQLAHSVFYFYFILYIH